MIIVLTHVVIATTSLLLSTVSAIFPSRTKLRASYVFIGLTLISGTVLVLVTKQPILKTCEAGLAYLAVATSGVLVSARRLAASK